MNTMDNAKVIEKMEKFTLQKYLEKMSDANLQKVTLFTVFPHTGAPNLSDPAYFVLVKDTVKFTALNSGSIYN